MARGVAPPPPQPRRDGLVGGLRRDRGLLPCGPALGTALAVGGLHLGPIDIEGGSLWIPILVIGIIYIPYLGRPVRGQVLSLREKEFVEAAVAQGNGPLRIMFGELLPNVASTILV